MSNWTSVLTADPIEWLLERDNLVRFALTSAIISPKSAFFEANRYFRGSTRDCAGVLKKASARVKRTLYPTRTAA